MSEAGFAKVTPPWTRSPDPRCMRGLHLVYETARPIPADTLAASLEEAFLHRLVRSEEAWGKQRVVRLVLQFRVELRLMDAATRADFILRETCPEGDRAGLRERFERALASSLAPHRPLPRKP